MDELSVYQERMAAVEMSFLQNHVPLSALHGNLFFNLFFQFLTEFTLEASNI